MNQAMAKFQVIYIYVIFLAWEFLANFFCAKIYIQMEKNNKSDPLILIFFLLLIFTEGSVFICSLRSLSTS